MTRVVLTRDQRSALIRLGKLDAEAPGEYFSITSIKANQNTLWQLSRRGLAEHLANNPYDPHCFKITDAGRAALEAK